MILNKPNKKKINVLGTEYSIIVEHEDSNCKYKDCGCDGYCDSTIKEIHIAITKPSNNDKENLLQYRKSVTRHEIIHAFLYESGLDVSSGCYNSWATNEEMVDWFAIQFPKIRMVFKELNI